MVSTREMFYVWISLSNIDLSGLITINKSNMYPGYSSLKSIQTYQIINIDTSFISIESRKGMFHSYFS